MEVALGCDAHDQEWRDDKVILFQVFLLQSFSPREGTEETWCSEKIAWVAEKPRYEDPGHVRVDLPEHA